jgi:hypothetical protein
VLNTQLAGLTWAAKSFGPVHQGDLWQDKKLNKYFVPQIPPSFFGGGGGWVLGTIQPVQVVSAPPWEINRLLFAAWYCSLMSKPHLSVDVMKR